MATQLGAYLKEKLVRHLFNFEDWAPPGTLYLALYTVTPTSDAGTGGTEVSGNAYARKALTINGATSWTQSGATVSNTNSITHGTPTGGNWGNLNGAALWDASSGGNFFGFADLTNAPVATTQDVPVVFGAGKLVFRLIVNP
jgi:hypothetical protein